MFALNGRLDVLVNSAGSTRLGCGIANTTVDEFGWHMDVNLKSAFLMIQKSLPHLEASKGNPNPKPNPNPNPHLEASKGCVVNVSSIASERPIPNCLPFCVSKAITLTLTLTLTLALFLTAFLSASPRLGSTH